MQSLIQNKPPFFKDLFSWFSIIDKENKRSQLYYWKLVLWFLFRRPRLFPRAITYSIYGFHFQRTFRYY